MSIQTIDGYLLQKMFLAGAANLEAKKEWINELNVFPVPDGDTGTNMTMTIMSAAKEVSAIDDPNMENLAKAISSGSLRGARGNSGVILSQLLRGFTKEVKKEEAIDSVVIARGCERAVETAYKAVMKPKEGTILTVAKGVGVKASEMAKKTDDLEEIISAAIQYGYEVLDKTPDMLPVLKEAGVVDSGGQGLMEFLQGAFDAFLGKEIDYTAVSGGEKADEGVKFTYETSFVLKPEKNPADIDGDLRGYLDSLGDIDEFNVNNDTIMVSMKTDDPGLAMHKGIKFGVLTNIKVSNLKDADVEVAAAPAEETPVASNEPRKPYGFISVSVGSGINEIFTSLGVDYIIEGGQTMNPSTADILDAADKVNADVIYVLPNNKNIILAAEQAEKLSKDKKIVVVPSKTIPQGIAAIINFNSEVSSEEALAIMTEELGNVKTGQVTYAVRDTSIDGIAIKEGNIMGIADKGIAAVGESVENTTVEMINTMVDEDSELISIYYGAEVSEEDANKCAKALEEKFPDLEIEVNKGDQPIYYYIVSVE